VKRVVRLGDHAAGTCTAHRSAVSWTGVFTTCSSVVGSEGKGIIRVGDTGTTSCGHTFQAIEGSSFITVEGIPVVREGDAVAVIQGGSGVVTEATSVIGEY